MHFFLASSSPRRAELLRAAGFAFDTIAVEIDETWRPGEAPAAYVRRLAAEKSARAAVLLGESDNVLPARPAAVGHLADSPGHPSRAGREPLIVAADTTVVV